MSNHLHIVATDVDGTLPAFLARVHRLIAACVNASYGRWENLWASEQASVVRLESREDVLDKITYTLANPVAAALVRTGSKWPGARTMPDHVAGHTERVRRPKVFFREGGAMPAVATLAIVPPPQCADMPRRELERAVTSLVQEREQRERQRITSDGRQFLGVRAVMAQKPTDVPRSPAPRRRLSPRIAAKSKWRRLEAIQRMKSFIDAYRRALDRLKAGARDVVFPAGTYAQRVFFGAQTAGPPSGTSPPPE